MEKDGNYEERQPLIAAAAERNKEAILTTLKEILPTEQPLQILEIASGTGQHVSHFAQTLTNFQWQPTDIDPSYIQSISSFIKSLGLRNVSQPIVGDVLKPISEWPAPIPEKQNTFDVVLCSNLMHISPWSCTLGLFATASKLLKPGTGLLLTYGPYAVNGVLSPESNINFDQWLKSTCPDWGVRDIRDLTQITSANGLQFQKSIDMPANNKVLVFKKIAA